MHASDSIVIIPTYNEKENIEKIIRAVFGLEQCFHILVIDDGSPDGTSVCPHYLTRIRLLYYRSIGTFPDPRRRLTELLTCSRGDGGALKYRA